MNTVSYLIYLTHVLPTLGVIFGVAAVVLGFVTLGTFVFWIISKGEASSYRATDDDKILSESAFSILKTATIGFIVSAVLTVIFPNQQTMYMIAASELGEEVIMSEEAKVLYQDLREILGSYKKKEDTN